MMERLRSGLIAFVNRVKNETRLQIACFLLIPTIILCISSSWYSLPQDWNDAIMVIAGIVLGYSIRYMIAGYEKDDINEENDE